MFQFCFPKCWNCPKNPWKPAGQGGSWIHQKGKHRNNKGMFVMASMHRSLCLLFHWTATIFPPVYLSLSGACCESTSTLHGGLQEFFVPWIKQFKMSTEVRYIPRITLPTYTKLDGSIWPLHFKGKHVHWYNDPWLDMCSLQKFTGASPIKLGSIRIICTRVGKLVYLMIDKI